MATEFTQIFSSASSNGVHYLVLFLIVLAGTYLGAFLREYAKRRGGQMATKADIENVLQQLAQTTEVTERIRNDIEHGTWRSKELEVLKREKLEGYLIHFYQAVENLSLKMRKALFGDKREWDDSSESMASMLQKLYLPELDQVHKDFLRVHGEFLQWVADGQTELVQKMKQGIPSPSISAEHMETYPVLLQKLNVVTLAIEMKCREIAAELNFA